MAEDFRKKRNFPALAIIVIALLVLMGLIALFQQDGGMRTQDAREDMPIDRADERPVMPDEARPGAPTPQAPGASPQG
jgi:hypothetical protein